MCPNRAAVSIADSVVSGADETARYTTAAWRAVTRSWGCRAPARGAGYDPAGRCGRGGGASPAGCPRCLSHQGQRRRAGTPTPTTWCRRACVGCPLPPLVPRGYAEATPARRNQWEPDPVGAQLLAHLAEPDQHAGRHQRLADNLAALSDYKRRTTPPPAPRRAPTKRPRASSAAPTVQPTRNQTRGYGR
jgi:hypothetical protein